MTSDEIKAHHEKMDRIARGDDQAYQLFRALWEIAYQLAKIREGVEIPKKWHCLSCNVEIGLKHKTEGNYHPSMNSDFVEPQDCL